MTTQPCRGLGQAGQGSKGSKAGDRKQVHTAAFPSEAKGSISVLAAHVLAYKSHKVSTVVICSRGPDLQEALWLFQIATEENEARYAGFVTAVVLLTIHGREGDSMNPVLNKMFLFQTPHQSCVKHLLCNF